MGGYIVGQLITRSALNNMFTFSDSIGFDYTGEWESRKKLVITIVNEYGAGPPIPGTFTVATKASGNLRNFPAACAATVRISISFCSCFFLHQCCIHECFVHARSYMNVACTRVATHVAYTDDVNLCRLQPHHLCKEHLENLPSKLHRGLRESQEVEVLVKDL